MNVLVLYFSRSGNTAALARGVADGARSVAGVEAVLRTPDNVTREDFLAAGALVAGSPVYFGGMAADLKSIFDRFVGLRKQMEGKVGAAFATSGDVSGGKETTLLSILQAMLIFGMIVTGDPLDATGHYGVSCVGAPGDRDLENARKLGRRVAQVALKQASGVPEG
ncbi:MAG: NAD(P)H-dependent oxidoreductase [Acidobacteria bacterium]|nr:NAD(P)H-dependent oxidoreductase [Acidobacteriota bacterium]